MSDQDNGVALQSVRHPYLVTDEMVEAGKKIMSGTIYLDTRSMLVDVYTAMRDAEPPEIDMDSWPSEDSIEAVEIEIKERE